MAIPRILHYCWFGPKPLPKQYADYIAGWRQVMPKYKIMAWTDRQLPDNPYVENAYAHSCWANLSNYMRFYALAKYGGIYLDTDVEVVQPFDELLDCGLFAGWQGNGQINNAVMASSMSHSFIVNCLGRLPAEYPGTERATLSSPHFMTAELFRTYGITKFQFNSFVDVKDIKVYPVRYFYPYWINETLDRSIHVTPETICIHHWAATWKTGHFVFNGNRHDLISRLPKNMRWVEIGTQRGNFAASILALTAPSKLTLVDLWKRQPDGTYADVANVSNEKHEKIYRYVLQRFTDEIAAKLVVVTRKEAVVAMREMSAGSADCIYLDANHSYQSTLASLRAARAIITSDGIIMGHDYCGGDGKGHVFGVMKAVSTFLRENPNLRFVGISNDEYPTYLIAYEQRAEKLRKLLQD